MRQSALIVAAFLAFAVLAPRAASAFEFDAQGSSNPDGSPKFVDPDENLNLGDTSSAQRFDQKMPGMTTNTVTIAPGLSLSGSMSGNGAAQTEPSWTNPQLGRVTH